MFASKFNVAKILINSTIFFSKNCKNKLNSGNSMKLKQLRPKTPDDDYVEMFHKTMGHACSAPKLKTQKYSCNRIRDEDSKKGDCEKPIEKPCSPSQGENAQTCTSPKEEIKDVECKKPIEKCVTTQNEKPQKYSCNRTRDEDSKKGDCEKTIEKPCSPSLAENAETCTSPKEEIKDVECKKPIEKCVTTQNEKPRKYCFNKRKVPKSKEKPVDEPCSTIQKTPTSSCQTQVKKKENCGKAATKVDLTEGPCAISEPSCGSDGSSAKKELKMDAIVFDREKKELNFQTVLLPDTLRKNEVSIRVQYAMASDLDLALLEGKLGMCTEAEVPGRELSGVVCGVGDQVDHVKAGDCVVVAPCYPGTLCRFCLDAKLCSCVKEGSEGMFGVTKNGAWAQFAAVPGHLVYKISDVPLDKAAILPLLGQVMCCLSKMNITPEKRILVQGCGLAGSLFALLLRHNGHEHVSIWEDNPNKVKRIPELGTGYPVVTQEELEGLNVNMVISSGAGTDVMTRAVAALNDFGEFFLFGQPGKNGSITQVKVNAGNLSKKNLTVSGLAGTIVNPSKISPDLANKLINLCTLGVPTHSLKEFKQGLTELTAGDVNSVLFHTQNKQ